MMSRVLPVDLNHRQSRADSEAAATWFKVPKILLSSPSVMVGRGIYHYISRTRSVAGLAGRAEYISVTVGREPRRPGPAGRHKGPAPGPAGHDNRDTPAV